MAVTAKLLPYSFIFIVMSILANYVFWCHAYTDGLWFWALNFTSALLVIYYAGAMVFCSLFFLLSIIISIVSMVGSLGATLGRLHFRCFTCLHRCTMLLSFSVRHFVEIGQNLFYGNYGLCVYVGANVACLAVVPYSPLLLLPHLKSLFNQSEI